MLKVRLGLCVVLLLGLLAGCGSRNPQAPGKIAGHVTYKNAPLPGGMITFHTEDKGNYPCPLGPDGSYEILDLPTGTLVVTVETESVNPKKKAPAYGGGKGAKINAEYQAAMQKGGAPIKQGPAPRYVRIPPRYADANASPLRATVEAGEQTQDFPLTD